jgi:hypothetical protein
MVKPETYRVPRGYNVPLGVKGMSTQTLVRGLDRASNGAWFVILKVNLEFHMKDGRVVKVVDKTLRLRATQEGKLPHPNPFGRKKARVTIRKDKK